MTSYEDLTEITRFDPLPALGRKKSGRKKTTIERTHCSRGHPLSGDNLYMRPRPNGRHKRECKECRDIHKVKWRQTHPEYRPSRFKTLEAEVLHLRKELQAIAARFPGHPAAEQARSALTGGL